MGVDVDMEEEATGILGMSLGTAAVTYLIIGFVLATLYRALTNYNDKKHLVKPNSRDPFDVAVDTLLGVLLWPLFALLFGGYGLIWLLGKFWSRVGWWSGK